MKTYTDTEALCCQCKEWKPRSEFSPSSDRSRGVTANCRPCRVVRRAERRVAVNAQQQSYRLKKYGLTLSDLADMLKAQSGACAICKQELPYGMNGLAIDHDHNSGFVRALLCVQCNLLIANARENVATLAAAIVYLEYWQHD